MKTIDTGASQAILIHTRESALQIYMQKYPFLHGPDRELNQKILELLPAATQIRQPVSGCTVERLSPGEARLPPDIQRKVRELFAGAGIDASTAEDAMDKLAWKFCDFPPHVRNILDVGCGLGAELIFLRAVAPEARILAVDWFFDLSPRLLEAARIEFAKVDVFDYLEKTPEVFDIVFSNHVLEHMYEPDRILKLLRRCVRSGGRLMSAMPLDGHGSCFPDTLSSLKGSSSPSWCCFGSIDIAHPWKTTPADLKESLSAAGFSAVRLLQREQHLSVMLAVDEAGMTAFRKRAHRLQGIVLKPLRLLATAVFRATAPHFVKRCFYALESRLWFGGNRFKNAESPEVLIIAG